MADATLSFNILTKYKDTGVRAATKDMDRLDRSVGKSSSTFSKFGGIAVKAGGLLGGIGFGMAIKGAIGLEAKFGQTMATIQAATGASTGEMKKFNDLAIKLGADTSFSAGEAADAMLNLAKAGLSTSTIMGGGVAGTLTLAAAGGTDLSTAATIASNALNTFNLKGKQMASVAAALAGGANASSASVESLGLGLQQVGPGAVNAGLSIQETVAALAAFDSAGIKGSDAGTSLKTMLTRLVPSTKKAKDEMRDLGLKFTDNQGRFKSLATISELLRDRMGKLSQEERSRAMNTIFGSDATRAATVLMGEGAKGIRGYIKATSDQSAAQKMAAARMSGTAGALERLKGSVETVALRFGQEMAPAVQSVANWLAEHLVPAADKTIAGIKKVVGFVDDNRTAMIALAATITALVVITKVHAAVMAVDAAGGMLKYLKATKLITAATKTYAAVQWLLNVALTSNPIGIVVVAVAALVAGIIIAYKKSDTFRTIVTAAFEGVKIAVEAVGKVGLWLWNNVFQPVFSFIVKGVADVLNFFGKMFDALSHVPKMGWAKDAADSLHNAADGADDLASNIRKIPTNKHVTITVDTHVNSNSIAGHYADVTAGLDRPSGGKSALPKMFASLDRPGGNSLPKVFEGYGANLIESLRDGIKGKVPVIEKALGKVTDVAQYWGDKLKDLLGKRSDIVGQFGGFTSSAFGASFSDKQGNDVAPTASGLIAFQKAELRKAKRLRSDTAKLLKMGLSKSLIQQMAASGESGIANIHALASGSAADVKALNSLNAATNANLNAAGMNAGNALYGEDIQQAKRNEAIAQAMAKVLRDALRDERRDHDKQTVINIPATGPRAIRASLLDLKRSNGGANLGLS